MTAATIPPLVATEELMALSDDGLERELIRGRWRAKPMAAGIGGIAG